MKCGGTVKWILIITGGLTLWMLLVLMIIGLLMLLVVAVGDVVMFIKGEKARVTGEKEVDACDPEDSEQDHAADQDPEDTGVRTEQEEDGEGKD